MDIGLLLYDIGAVNLSFFLALWFRFDCQYSMIPGVYMEPFFRFAPVYSLFCIAVFSYFRLYKSIWRFASYNELARVLASVTIVSIFHIVGITVTCQLVESIKVYRMPLFYYAFGVMLQAVLLLVVRFSYRFILLLWGLKRKGNNLEYSRRVMLIGAGTAGQTILRDLHEAVESNERVCCIIDDNPDKWSRFIDGVPIVGGREDILQNVEKYHIEKILIAIPSASAGQRRDILNICKETGCELKILPGIYQLANGEVAISHMKEVAIEDLLGREPIKVNLDEVFQYLNGKVILVTGGGGSIGSELCRQIARHNPQKLIIFDVYENNAYEIQQELRANYPNLKLEVLIGSVRDSRRINSVFATYRPEVVYHAAAHKHVPLMEDSPREAIKNNAIGTYKTAYAAMMNGCKRFVLISTDKAVNPTNIMGASKRLCEMVIQTFDEKIKAGKAGELPVLYAHSNDEDGSMRGMGGQTAEGAKTEAVGIPFRLPEKSDMNVVPAKTEFVAVRFGNVLGSNGSVIPFFKKQIAAGGPVTVTHPDIVRYFMTISEAVSLVLQAGTYARGGEIFVLDMGEPVKIDALAKNLIKLSGFKPDVDIKIEYVGLRPGEKLYEEKLMEEEGMKTTPSHLIHIGAPIPFDTDRFLVQLKELMDASYGESRDIRELVAEVVETYRPYKRVEE
ncbi:MAG: polysaccharide biosynthesis protein [Lachnospiraceae bacterium]|nr:polysaccharide biosynthesis protein [Lachnospiraceae bacterium]